MSIKFSTPPASRLLAVSDFLFSKKIHTLVFDAVADLREEYYEALAEKRNKKAKWVVFRGYLSVGSLLAMQLPLSMLKKIVALWNVV